MPSHDRIRGAHGGAITAIIVLAVLLAAAALAQEQFIYPSKGQSSAQQEKDRFECYGWAKGQTGFDPMAPPRTSSAPPSRGTRSVAGGAIGGGAVGAGVGAIGGAIAGGKAGKGAMIGAAAGGLLGGMGAAGQNARASQDYQDWERREANQYAAARRQYDRAFGACMEGRGYTVK
jgi:hypothetical protein